jgi:hypothetical protein
MSMAKKVQLVKTTVTAAIADAFSELQALGEECREVFDNMPESLQGCSRGEALSASADTLESLSEPDDAPACVADVEVEYLPRPKRRTGRGARRDEAVSMLEAAKQAVEDKKQELGEDAKNERSEEAQADIDALDSLYDELDTLVSEAEGCEFPGMFS